MREHAAAIGRRDSNSPLSVRIKRCREKRWRGENRQLRERKRNRKKRNNINLLYYSIMRGSQRRRRSRDRSEKKRETRHAKPMRNKCWNAARMSSNCRRQSVSFDERFRLSRDRSRARAHIARAESALRPTQLTAVVIRLTLCRP